MTVKESDGSYDSRHIHCKGYASSAVERRVAVEHLRYGTESVVEELFFEAHHLSFYKAETAHLVDFEVCFQIESGEPRPCGAIMIGFVSIPLHSGIVGAIASALGAQASQSFGRDQFAGTNVKGSLALLFSQW